MSTQQTSNGRKLITIPTIALVTGWCATVLGAVWVASAERTQMVTQVQADRQELADHEIRLRNTERQLADIAADVRWIRKTLEAQAKP